MKRFINILGIAYVLFFMILSKAYATDVAIGVQKIALPSVWKFKIDPKNVGEENKWYLPLVSTAGWDSLSVPGNWDLQNEYAKYKGKAWYKTHFKVPKVTNQRIVLLFGEVGTSYKVYVNGHLAASILCGNYEETIDITRLAKVGIDNQLTVMVDNSLFWGAYWNWGGIRRPVSLLLQSPIFISRQAVVATPDLQKGTAHIATTFFVTNTTTQIQKVLVGQKIGLPTQLQKTLASTVLNVPAQSTFTYTTHIDLSKEEVQLWHFDHPHLYKSVLTLSLPSSNQPIYQLSNRFGIRKIALDGYQFKLNGESVRLAGYNWVADDRTTGSMLPEWRFKEDIDLMKIAGANMARLSHRPLPEDVMDYLDEKGILVMSEFNNWPEFMNARSAEPKLFAEKLIQQSFNHPCVFGWSVGNENGNLKENPEVNEYVSSIIQYIKTKVDSSRMVAYVSNTADFQDNDAAQYCDVIMINKYGNYEKGVDELKKRYPNKAVFMSEYGSHTDNLIYDTPDKTLFKSMMVDNLATKENLFGYSLWTFNDYRSTYQAPNPATTTPVHQNRQWGIVDVYHNKKRAFTQMQQFYAPIKQMTARWPNQNEGTISCTIRPRAKMDIPSYTLVGYHLVWEVRNSNNTTENLGVLKLANIQPGSDTLQYVINWPKKTTDAFVKIALLSPTGYAVIDTTIYLATPPQPLLPKVITAGSEARVFFEKNDFTREYVVYYQSDGPAKSLKPTIHHFADISGLTFGKTYKIWVVAQNSYGDSKPSEVVTYVPKAGYVILPPVVWLSEPTNNGFFVGYGYHYTDQQYDVRYGLASQPETTWKEMSTNNFALMKVDGLKNGQKYAYQIRRRPAFIAAPSQWSERLELIPNKAHFYGKAILHGYRQFNQELLLSISPAHNAIGYQVTTVTASGKSVYRINQSIPTCYMLPLNNADKITSVSVEAIQAP